MALNYYRSDGWVKAVQGQAISGAQIYVCTQPANVTPPVTPPRTTPVPWVGPNPQALIYSDNGLTPIVQPIITDGFGHYDFYVLPGLYTVVVMFNGKVQQFYPDQSIGNVGSSSGTAVLFSTNGSPNFNQTLQNLVQGANISIVTDNVGNTVISGTGGGGSISLKTNGVPNSSQSLLNLLSGSGVTLIDQGGGSISVNEAVATGLWFTSIQSIAGITPNASDSKMVDSISAGGGCSAVCVSLSKPVTVRNITLNVITPAGGSHGMVAVYTADGTAKIIDPGANAFDTGSIAVVTAALLSPITLPAGNYLVAWSNDGGSGNVRVTGVDSTSSNLNFDWLQILNKNSNRYVRATNGISGGGSMPATLGVLNIPSSGQRFDVPAILFE